MRSFYILCFCFLSGIYLKAQPGWSSQTSGTTTQLNSVYFVSDSLGWAVGSNGIIKNTSDSGKTWNTQAIGLTTQSMNTVFFINSLKGWAAGTGGRILKTSNAGVLWEKKTSGITSNLNGIYFRNDTLGWAVGSSGIILKTTNGGDYWYPQVSGSTTFLSSVFFINDSVGWAVGQTGLILHTSNGGTIWSAQISGTTNWLLSVRFTSPLVGYAVGATGTILKTSDGGLNWKSIETKEPSSFISVSFPSTSTGWVVGNGGVIYTTKNAGETWTSETSGTANNLEGVYFPSLSNGWAVGAGGTILKYSCKVPDKPMLLLPPGSIHCVGSSFTYSVVKDPKISKYIWTFPTGWEGKSDSNSIVLKATNKSEAGPLTVMAVNECGNSLASTLLLSKPDSTLNQPSVITAPSIHCAGSVQLYSVVKDNKASEYIWTFPAGWQGKSDSSSIVLKANENAEAGTLTVVAVNECGNSAGSSLSLAKPYDVPKPTITEEGAVLKTEDNANLNYQWKREQTLVGTNKSSYEPEKSGMYKVVVSDKTTGCQDSSDAFLFIITAIEKNIADADFNIYPNPASEVLTISLGNQISSGAVSILSLDGKVVFQKLIDGGTFDLSLQKIPKGLYVVKFQSVGQRVYKKLSIE